MNKFFRIKSRGDYRCHSKLKRYSKKHVSRLARRLAKRLAD